MKFCKLDIKKATVNTVLQQAIYDAIVSKTTGRYKYEIIDDNYTIKITGARSTNPKSPYKIADELVSRINSYKPDILRVVKTREDDQSPILLEVYVNPDYINQKFDSLPEEQKNHVNVDLSRDINFFNGDNSLMEQERKWDSDDELQFQKLNKPKEYTSQALINTKIAALKEVAKKYPRSLNDNQSLQEGLNWLKSVNPNVQPEIVQGLIDGIANGSYNSNLDLITLSEEFANKKTVKHEMLHKILASLPFEQREAILNEASKKYGIARGESKTTTKYSQVQQNEINYALKAVDILQSAKGDEIFRKGDKNNWDIDKILQELQIPKQQQNLIKEFNTRNREQILTNLLANYSYTVEINTAKENVSDYDMIDRTGEGDFEPVPFELDTDLEIVEDENGNPIDTKIVLSEKGKRQLEERKNKRKPTQHYSNLTVPGGTNYTENEISTPLITPSIKGHAQFSTDNGIGWFRSDEQVMPNTNPENVIKQPGALSNTSLNPFGYGSHEEFIKATEIYESTFRPATKTRRILEVQSDLFQKGRDVENLVAPYLTKETSNQSGNKIEDIGDVRYIYDVERNVYKKAIKNGETSSLKWDWYDITRSEFESATGKIKNEGGAENQFLQLLNKDNNWVTFFIKSIIQDSAKKGYEKVLFPTGNTASKVEGHETLEEFKKEKKYRITTIGNQLISDYISKNNLEENPGEKITYKGKSGIIASLRKEFKELEGAIYTNENNEFKLITTREALREKLSKDNEEINQLKQELERVETEGFGALKPIYNFYENTVTNILNKTYGKENVKVITDEYGNTWNEIDLSSEKVKQQTDKILFQSPKLQYTGDLAIEEKIAEEAENSKDEIVAKTPLQKFIQSIKNLLRNIFKERDKISRLLRDMNQGRLNSNYKNNTNQDIKYQLSKEQSEGIIASEKTIRDLAARMSDRIGIPFRIISDRTQQFKGKIENNVAYVNLAYATLDTPIHEILGHPIIRAIKNNKTTLLSFNDWYRNKYGQDKSNWDSRLQEYEDYKNNQKLSNQLYQNLLKELETGKGKEVLDRIKRDYRIKDERVGDINESKKQLFLLKENGYEYKYYYNPKLDKYYREGLGTKEITQEEYLEKAQLANVAYTLEEQQEEAIVELMSLMVADKLNKITDKNLISLLKQLLKQINDFIKSLLNSKELNINDIEADNTKFLIDNKLKEFIKNGTIRKEC